MDEFQNKKEYENEIYQLWLDKECFKPKYNFDKNFSICIPPPNVTGSLHMGHALNNTIQDILTRYHRMNGFNTLWQPGTDHAGIATQMVVERNLAEKNIYRKDLTREEFIEKIWEWKEYSGSTIINQLKRLGSSCDWSRERFTMDDGLSSAVRKVFVKLYTEGLIYKDQALVNWDTKFKTAISDLEVVPTDVSTQIYYIKYPSSNSESITVATVRPETIFGDVAIAVNPNDSRYASLKKENSIWSNSWDAAGKSITWDMIHYDVQLIGGIALHQGKIAEMQTGEGKTLVATLPVYLNALSGNGVHLITVNDYLAKRDSEEMGKIYNFLGLSSGFINNYQNDIERKKNYNCDITYATNSELGFDYLRDNMKFGISDMVQRPFNFAIIDEVDSILIDEARTPLIISGQAEDSSVLYNKIDKIIPQLSKDDYELDEKQRTCNLTENGILSIEKLLIDNNLIENGSLYDVNNVNLLHHINQALKAHTLFKKNTHYMVKNNSVVIIDEFTGRVLGGRRFSDGLHQAIEAKENVKIEEENHIIFFNFSRRLVPLITELCKAYENEKQSFVIVSNEDSLIVMEKIRSVIKIPKNITILARKGAAWQKSVLDRINLEKAKQLIILKPDISELFKTEMDCDVEVGKSLSSIIGSKEYSKNPCKILSEFHNERTGMAHIFFSHDIWGKKTNKLGNDWIPEIISSSELKSDILSQCINL